MRRHAVVLVTSILLLASAVSASAQQGAIKGEWHYYGGDAGNT